MLIFPLLYLSLSIIVQDFFLSLLLAFIPFLCVSWAESKPIAFLLAHKQANLRCASMLQVRQDKLASLCSSWNHVLVQCLLLPNGSCSPCSMDQGKGCSCIPAQKGKYPQDNRESREPAHGLHRRLFACLPQSAWGGLGEVACHSSGRLGCPLPNLLQPCHSSHSTPDCGLLVFSHFPLGR